MSKAPSVAVIDEDPSASRALSRLLSGAGFATSEFSSAEAFLADPRNPAFASLVVDMQLPGISGLELQRQLLAQGDRTPLIFLTADDDAATRAEAIHNGCAGYFRKTDPGAVLITTLRRTIAGAAR
jgi:FixJ family two-component response regulator